MIDKERGYIVMSDITVVEGNDELTIEEILDIILEKEKEIGKADKWTLYAADDYGTYDHVIRAALYRLETEKEKDARVERQEREHKEAEKRTADREKREKEQELAEYKRLKEKYGDI